MSTELRRRIASAVVLAIVVLVATWYGGLAFRMVAAAMAVLIYYEWSTITRAAERDFRANAFGWVAIFLIAIDLLVDEGELSVPILGGAIVTAVLLVLLRKGSWWLPGGILYAGLSGISLAAIRAEDQAGFVATLFIFAVVWATDILAYFVGRALKGPKLAPRISPGKTWSGAVGGTVSGVIASSALTLGVFSRLSAWTVAIAFLLSVASQIGDLFESFIKRRFGVKDSSHLIPGHGGVMDRVDGLVFACFAAFLLTLVYTAMTGHLDVSVAGFLFGF
ncbi:phosphatidate cytidylyltransferase [Neorhizobium galegae]|uniref:phosphatidate cytidylyltransferase n=1 Tax=Neorhizobium galegae TaxID=399 RepID=UPI000621331C|nr:phosphatidate cytidylyltransferase [Neorhizobium galegae]MCQ1764894.1 phosphatidate cytidylyltransferase [Neorhizobium galegae]MCQ1848984.1 phosphatidate cytidylyltransferase [Neorhizobium galegae]CDZ38696.1 Phosphatidate cytidylyltransferase [Neorhizobium galegae bv. officinalis]